MDYIKLLSGSDVRGNAETELTDEFLNKFSASFSYYLYTLSDSPSIVIGRDSRISGRHIEQNLLENFSRNGISVIALTREGKDDDVSTTPIIAEAVRYFDTTGGIIITASHLPKHWNGLKIFIGKNYLPKNDLKKILKGCNGNYNFKEKQTGTILSKNFCKKYCNNMVEMIQKGIGKGDKPLKGFHIIVDAGNGASGFFAENILEPLGANITGSLYLNPDGLFPNHIPNPEDKDAIKDLCEAVVREKADFGIIFDTDGDRSSVVFSDGKAVVGNRILALVYSMVLEDKKGSTVVSDSVTSDGLAAFVSLKGGVYRRYKRGYANVRSEMMRLNEKETVCFVGGETSGHIMFTENNYADDGSYTVARLLIYLASLRSRGMDFSQVLEDLKEPLDSVTFRLIIDTENFIDYGKEIIDAFIVKSKSDNFKFDTTEGIRVTFNDSKGWALVRLSLHEPLLVINAESDKISGINEICSWIISILNSYKKIDTSKLEAFIS